MSWHWAVSGVRARAQLFEPRSAFCICGQSSQAIVSSSSPFVIDLFPATKPAGVANMATAQQGAISKRRKFVADGVFYAELNEFFQRELAEEGYSGVEVRVTPTVTDISTPIPVFPTLDNYM